MKTFAIVSRSLVLGMMFAASAGAWAQADVIASVGQASVTQADLTSLLKSFDADTRTRLAADPQKLDQLVRVRLAQSAVIADAKAKGWDQQPQVKAMMSQAQREVLMRSYLASVSAPAADYPSDQDIQAAYARNQAAFNAPRAVHIAQIYLAVPPGADAATQDRARKHAADLAKQAHAGGADFAALATANSQDKASAARGGDMGFLPETALLPEIRKAADAMKPGDVSQPVQTSTGFHVVKLIDTRPAGVRPLAEVKEQIRAALRQQREQENANAYMAKTLGAGTVAINEPALKKALGAATQ